MSIWWQVGSATLAFSADVPAVASYTPAKAIMSTGTFMISISGSNYGSSALSVSASVRASVCEFSLWISSSHVVCKSNSGSAAGLAIAASN